MRITADFHVHSKYSRATSRNMDIPTIAKWAKYKGIQLMGSGDWTHPLWLGELKRELQPAGEGFYQYGGIYFFLTTEVSNIYYRAGRGHRVHNIIFAPDFNTVDKINRQLSNYGNLLSDGRPVVSLDCEDMVRIILDISAECLIVPSHAWTPHFSVFGSNSGFNSLTECFGTQAKNICCIETGLSSDPPMNWRISKLDAITLISNSDAHSPHNIGREANVFELSRTASMYSEIIEIIKNKDAEKFLFTIEFFPEEGKYHFDGHRNCKVRMHPQESKAAGNVCPDCRNPLTLGVLHRVEELSDRDSGDKPVNAIPYKNIIPLEEIIAEAINVGKGSSKVERECLGLVGRFGSEFSVLLDAPEHEILGISDARIAEGIVNMRLGEVDISPGYDGEYGKVSIRRAQPVVVAEKVVAEKKEQLSLF